MSTIPNTSAGRLIDLCATMSRMSPVPHLAGGTAWDAWAARLAISDISNPTPCDATVAHDVLDALLSAAKAAALQRIANVSPTSRERAKQIETATQDITWWSGWTSAWWSTQVAHRTIPERLTSSLLTAASAQAWPLVSDMLSSWLSSGRSLSDLDGLSEALRIVPHASHKYGLWRHVIQSRRSFAAWQASSPAPTVRSLAATADATYNLMLDHLAPLSAELISSHPVMTMSNPTDLNGLLQRQIVSPTEVIDALLAHSSGTPAPIIPGLTADWGRVLWEHLKQMPQPPEVSLRKMSQRPHLLALFQHEAQAVIRCQTPDERSEYDDWPASLVFLVHQVVSGGSLGEALKPNPHTPWATPTASGLSWGAFACLVAFSTPAGPDPVAQKHWAAGDPTRLQSEVHQVLDMWWQHPIYHPIAQRALLNMIKDPQWYQSTTEQRDHLADLLHRWTSSILATPKTDRLDRQAMGAESLLAHRCAKNNETPTPEIARHWFDMTLHSGASGSVGLLQGVRQACQLGVFELTSEDQDALSSRFPKPPPALQHLILGVISARPTDTVCAIPKKRM